VTPPDVQPPATAAAPFATSLPPSAAKLKAAISSGQQMASQEAELMLRQKTLQALSILPAGQERQPPSSEQQSTLTPQ
jgi:hypothetical protein